VLIPERVRAGNFGMNENNEYILDSPTALARRAINSYVTKGETIKPEEIVGLEPREAGVFVSLHMKDGSLRGCIGTLQATRNTIEEEIVNNAISAATRDPRFKPLAEKELSELDISVDVLGIAEKVDNLADLNPKEYGLIVQTADGRRALLLPDLEGVETAEEQLHITCRKGNIDPAHDSYELFRFRVTRYH